VENVTKPKTQLDLRLGNSMLKKCGWRRERERCVLIQAPHNFPIGDEIVSSALLYIYNAHGMINVEMNNATLREFVMVPFI